jgi:hypothetical protein
MHVARANFEFRMGKAVCHCLCASGVGIVLLPAFLIMYKLTSHHVFRINMNGAMVGWVNVPI